MPAKSKRTAVDRKPISQEERDDAELKASVAAEIASWYRPSALPATRPTESNEALNARLNGLVGRHIELRAPDGRIFIVPPTEPIFAGDPIPIVLDVEAATRTRLKDGGNPNWFIRLHRHFRERRHDPNGGASFAEYAGARHPDKIDTEAGKGENVKPDPGALAGAPVVCNNADGPGAPDMPNYAGTPPQPMPKKKLSTAGAETEHRTPMSVVWLWKIISDSVAAVPANKYAKGIVGIAAALSLILIFPHLNQRFAVVGIVTMIVLMVALLVFSWANRFGGSEHKPLIRFFLWAMMAIFVVFVIVLFTTFAFGIPAHATKLLYG